MYLPRKEIPPEASTKPYMYLEDLPVAEPHMYLLAFLHISG